MMQSSFCVLFSVTRRSRSDVRQSVSHSLTQGTDRDFTDVTLVSEDTNRRLFWCDHDDSDGHDDPGDDEDPDDHDDHDDHDDNNEHDDNKNHYERQWRPWWLSPVAMLIFNHIGQCFFTGNHCTMGPLQEFSFLRRIMTIQKQNVTFTF